LPFRVDSSPTLLGCQTDREGQHVECRFPPRPGRLIASGDEITGCAFAFDPGRERILTFLVLPNRRSAIDLVPQAQPPLGEIREYFSYINPAGGADTRVHWAERHLALTQTTELA
jgi:hypothetical protein